MDSRGWSWFNHLESACVKAWSWIVGGGLPLVLTSKRHFLFQVRSKGVMDFLMWLWRGHLFIKQKIVKFTLALAHCNIKALWLCQRGWSVVRTWARIIIHWSPLCLTGQGDPWRVVTESLPSIVISSRIWRRLVSVPKTLSWLDILLNNGSMTAWHRQVHRTIWVVRTWGREIIHGPHLSPRTNCHVSDTISKFLMRIVETGLSIRQQFLWIIISFYSERLRQSRRFGMLVSDAEVVCARSWIIIILIVVSFAEGYPLWHFWCEWLLMVGRAGAHVWLLHHFLDLAHLGERDQTHSVLHVCSDGHAWHTRCVQLTGRIRPWRRFSLLSVGQRLARRLLPTIFASSLFWLSVGEGRVILIVRLTHWRHRIFIRRPCVQVFYTNKVIILVFQWIIFIAIAFL